MWSALGRRAPGRTRTDTGRILRPLPLPIGLPGRSDVLERYRVPVPRLVPLGLPPRPAHAMLPRWPNAWIHSSPARHGAPSSPCTPRSTSSQKPAEEHRSPRRAPIDRRLLRIAIRSDGCRSRHGRRVDVLQLRIRNYVSAMMEGAWEAASPGKMGRRAAARCGPDVRPSRRPNPSMRGRDGTCGRACVGIAARSGL